MQGTDFDRRVWVVKQWTSQPLSLAEATDVPRVAESSAQETNGSIVQDFPIWILQNWTMQSWDLLTLKVIMPILLNGYNSFLF